MNKFLIRQKTLSNIFITSCMILLCSCGSNNAENEECQRELLSIETFYNIAQERISLLEAHISELQIKDSLLSIVIFQSSNLIKDSVNKKCNSSQDIDEFINNIINESCCKNRRTKKKELSILLRKLKESELKCENYLAQMYRFTQSDSIYREKLGLELVPFEILLKTKKANESQEDLIKEYEYAKQIDIKINKLTFFTYYITRSYSEIIKAIEG